MKLRKLYMKSQKVDIELKFLLFLVAQLKERLSKNLLKMPVKPLSRKEIE